MKNNLTGLERISNFSKKFSAISNYLGYEKFVNEKPNILVFDQSSWIIPDILNALDKLHFHYRKVNVGHLDPQNRNLTLDQYIRFHQVLIKELIDFKPDCILTINHAAFDSLGLLTKILEQFQIPTISWFVDSPLYIFKNAEPQKSQFLNLFCWEKTYLERLRTYNFQNLYYLPLASNPDVFSNVLVNPDEEKTYSCDIAFVGNTNIEGVGKFKRKEFEGPGYQNLIENAIKIQLTEHSLQMKDILVQADTEHLLENIDDELKISLETYCVLKATEVQRYNIVELLVKEFGIKIFGDEKWKNYFPNNYIKPLDYYKELPKLYRCAKIVINVTSLQMNSAINQRSFDAFLAGGFVISDYRADYDLLFGEGIFPAYKNEEEMISMIKYYLKYENERKLKSSEIAGIVSRNHLYENRIIEMMKVVSDKYNEKNRDTL